MPTFNDDELGTITVRHSAKSRSVRMRIAPDGGVRISAPLYTPTMYIKRIVKHSRKDLQDLLDQHQSTSLAFYDGMQVGKSHHLMVREGNTIKVERHGQQILATLPNEVSMNDTKVVTAIREAVISALRVEAKSYLPKRLAYLASEHGYSYKKVRFSHASGRWGSCSSNLTISLNIALMKLPFELIDYVLIHELAHTREMNHSTAFWAHVEDGDRDYKMHKKILKSHSPSI